MFDYDSLSRTSRVLVPSPNIARMMTHIWVPSPNCALSWVLVHLRIRSRMFGQVRVVRVTHTPTNSPADRSPARVRLWPSAGTRRGQYAGSALLRSEAVHTVLTRPCTCAVSCLVFVRAKRATDSSTTHARPTSSRLLASWITSQLDFIDLNHSYPLSMAHGMHFFIAKRPVSSCFSNCATRQRHPA